MGKTIRHFVSARPELCDPSPPLDAGHDPEGDLWYEWQHVAPHKWSPEATAEMRRRWRLARNADSMPFSSWSWGPGGDPPSHWPMIVRLGAKKLLALTTLTLIGIHPDDIDFSTIGMQLPSESCRGSALPVRS